MFETTQCYKPSILPKNMTTINSTCSWYTCQSTICQRQHSDGDADLLLASYQKLHITNISFLSTNVSFFLI
jgi:hypothetical protein